MNKFDLWRQTGAITSWGKTGIRIVYGKQIITSIEKMADTPFDYPNDHSRFDLPYYFFALHAKVIAYSTKGTKHFANKKYKDEIIEELSRIYKEEYNMSTSPENWWLAELGNSLRVLNILTTL